MSKKPVYWLGFGSGLIIGAVLIRLMSAASGPEPVDETTLAEAAARYGYRLVGENDNVTVVNNSDVRSIYITPDMTTEQLSELLIGAKLLDNREQFVDAIERLPDTSSIRPGYYEFREPLSVAELVDRLTE